LNRVANMSIAGISVRPVTRRRARTRASYYLADGLVAMVLLAAMLISYSYYHQMRAELSTAREEFARVDAQTRAASVENERLAAEIEALRRDPETIEKAARQELGLVREGEVVLTLDQSPSVRP
jgi:cell division protein FtsB